MVSCQKGPTRHAYAWQIGPFWQDTLELSFNYVYLNVIHKCIQSYSQPWFNTFQYNKIRVVSS